MPNFIALHKNLAEMGSFKGLNEGKEHLRKQGKFAEKPVSRIHTL